MTGRWPSGMPSTDRARCPPLLALVVFSISTGSHVVAPEGELASPTRPQTDLRASALAAVDPNDDRLGLDVVRHGVVSLPQVEGQVEGVVADVEADDLVLDDRE
jgi:hypothetical protein